MALRIFEVMQLMNSPMPRVQKPTVNIMISTLAISATRKPLLRVGLAA